MIIKLGLRIKFNINIVLLNLYEVKFIKMNGLNKLTEYTHQNIHILIFHIIFAAVAISKLIHSDNILN
jgi:hypothetical protein